MSQLAFEQTRPRLYGTDRRYVREADRREVDWMIKRHYLGKWPRVTVAILGLFSVDGPRGVCVFSLPPNETFSRQVADEDEAREIARTLNEDRRMLSREQRLPVVVALREDGHSQRAIAGALGVTGIAGSNAR